MMTEVYSNIDTTMLYYGTPDGSRLGAHFTFNFWTFIMGLSKGFSGSDLAASVQNWLDHVPSAYTSNWVLGNHDQTRVSTRLGPENIDALNMLVALLPGIQVTYNGEEIGQENGEVTCEEGYDPQAIKNCSTFNETSRDFQRTPIQWDTTVNAGFNDGAKPWLPVSSKYLQTNLADQEGDNLNSHYNIYRQLLNMRHDFKDGFQDLNIQGTSELLSLEKVLPNGNVYNYIFNVQDNEYVFSDDADIPGEVVIRSSNSEYNQGDAFNASQPLKPREAVIFKKFNY
ncbi:hypothetical protein GWI33_012527 [Rhynchophorus ferrugineus]|uniref:Glycosyl hydrolase family 13 catalytic domain-containing protein n=1 Tax=Rhynchophorus ferrugineus TaxID=354439 RepID=A0A834I854_RHYFE|nr:hypothetical protein GWI33_012527 [Rhynchophorus ferrugineus]